MVIIKNMDMPENCSECRFNFTQSGSPFCVETSPVLTPLPAGSGIKRPDFCPLDEVLEEAEENV